jgi:hypothetical protein
MPGRCCQHLPWLHREAGLAATLAATLAAIPCRFLTTPPDMQDAPSDDTIQLQQLMGYGMNIAAPVGVSRNRVSAISRRHEGKQERL